MKFKFLITAILCLLLLTVGVSCGRGDAYIDPPAAAPQDSSTDTQGESAPDTIAPDEVTDETPTETHDPVETETVETPICEHVFEDGFCTLCGSDTTVLFKFGQSGFSFDETYHIYGTQGTLPATLTIPDTYNGKPVTHVKSHAIQGSDTLTELIVPDTVALGSYCIEDCPNLQTLRMSLYSLPSGSFMERNLYMILDLGSRKNLTTVYISSATLKLVESVFSGCDSLESVYLPAELKEVEAYVFSGCKSLTNIVVDEANPFFYVKNNCLINRANKMIVAAGAGAIIPDDGSVTAIGSGAFTGLNLSKELVIPDCIKTIGFAAFRGWTSLEKLTLPFVGYSATDSDGHIGNLFGEVYDMYNEKSVPTGLKEITILGGKLPSYGLRGCKGLTTVNLEGVTSIEGLAFMDCPKLKTVHLGKKLSSLKNLPTGVTVTLNEENPYFSLHEDGTFYNKDGTVIVLANKNTVLPTDGSLLEIGESAFAGCYTQQTLVIPDSVTRIGKNAFAGNTSLRELTLPASLTDIGEGAFSDCNRLNRVYGGTNVEWIGASAFEGCTGLLTVEPMPALKAVSAKAFLGCHNLRAVPWDENAYQLKIISESAFEKCAKISEVVLPETVSILGRTAFLNCTSLETVVLSSKLKTIPGTCFGGCTALRDVTFKEGLQAIEYGAFSGCKSLNEVILPDSLVSLDQVTFSGIKTLHIGSGLTEISHNSLPDSIETVTLSEDNPRFYLSSGSLVDAETETLIWGNGREHMLTFDRPFKAVGDHAFYGRTNLYVITLPEGCESIGDSAFAYCTKLVEVNFPSTLKSMHDDAFTKCPACDDMEIPKGVEIIK